MLAHPVWGQLSALRAQQVWQQLVAQPSQAKPLIGAGTRSRPISLRALTFSSSTTGVPFLCDRSVGIYRTSFVLLVCVARCTSLHVAYCCRGIGRSSGTISMRGTVLDSCSVLQACVLCVCACRCAVAAFGPQCDTRKEQRGALFCPCVLFVCSTRVIAHADDCTRTHASGARTNTQVMCARKHAPRHARTHARTHACHVRTHSNTHTHARTHANANVRMHVRTSLSVRTCTRALVGALRSLRMRGSAMRTNG